MNDIKKKIVMDLLVTPTTVSLSTVGASILLISWAVGAGAMWSFFGVLGILGAVGAIFTNWINIDSIAKNAALSFKKEKEKTQEEDLETFSDQLYWAEREDTNKERGKDTTKDRIYLHEIRSAYKDLKTAIEAGTLSSYVDPETLLQVEKLFQACVKRLRSTHDMWLASKFLYGDQKKQKLKERRQILTEIGKSVEQFTENVTAIRSLSHKAEDGEMATLRDALDRSLEIARRTEAEMNGTNPGQKYEEFLK